MRFNDDVNTVDIVLVVLLAAGALRGFSRGLIRQVVSLAGFGAALFLAGQRYADLAVALRGLAGQQFAFLRTPTIANVIAFALILVAVIVVANLAGELLHRLVGLLFLGFLNSVGGLVFGVAEAAFLLSVAVLLLTVLSPSLAAALTDDSTIAATVLSLSPLLLSFLPGTLFPAPGALPQFL